LTTSQQAPLIDIGGKVITLWQPYASAVIIGTPREGFKDVENRSWAPPQLKARELPFRLYIHAGAETDPDAPDWAYPAGDRAALPHKCVLGYVTLHEATNGWHPSKWADAGDWHWWLRNPVAFPRPVEMRGWQTLWTPRATQQDEARQILAAVEEAAALATARRA
jgi:hypothetical protein